MEVIIANPVAGRGFARKGTEMLHSDMLARQVDHQVWFTESTGHATLLAQKAVREGVEVVWAVGGDATLSEVAGGMLGSGVPLGVIPCGTGNDLCRVLNVPARMPLEAYRAQRQGTRGIDVWQANERIFLNVAGTGFDVETLVHSRRYRKLPGSTLPYMLALLQTIFTHKNVHLRLTIDGETVQKDVLLFCMGNGRYFGGGMPAAPDAILDDGLLDVVTVAPVPNWRIPFLLPKFLRGTHIGLPITTVQRAKEIRIDCGEDSFFQLDGDLLGARELVVRKCEQPLLLRAVTPDAP